MTSALDTKRRMVLDPRKHKSLLPQNISIEFNLRFNLLLRPQTKTKSFVLILSPNPGESRNKSKHHGKSFAFLLLRLGQTFRCSHDGRNGNQGITQAGPWERESLAASQTRDKTWWWINTECETRKKCLLSCVTTKALSLLVSLVLPPLCHRTQSFFVRLIFCFKADYRM